MRWEVHLNPGPKGPDGKPVDMQSIFDGIDNGSLATVKKGYRNEGQQAVCCGIQAHARSIATLAI